MPSARSPPRAAPVRGRRTQAKGRLALKVSESQSAADRMRRLKFLGFNSCAGKGAHHVRLAPQAVERFQV